MTSFEDGPAAGKVLMLRGAARFLRVTQSAGDEFDGLDQRGDEARPDELVYAYEIVAKPGGCHIRGKGYSGFYPVATYKEVRLNPPDEKTMRDNRAWTLWCVQRAEAYPREDLK